jgi:hypothetical protein
LKNLHSFRVTSRKARPRNRLQNQPPEGQGTSRLEPSPKSRARLGWDAPAAIREATAGALQAIALMTCFVIFGLGWAMLADAREILVETHYPHPPADSIIDSRFDPSLNPSLNPNPNLNLNLNPNPMIDPKARNELESRYAGFGRFAENTHTLVVPTGSAGGRRDREGSIRSSDGGNFR